MKISTLLLAFSFILLTSCFSDRDDNLDVAEEQENNEPVPTEQLIAEDSELFTVMESITTDYPFETEMVCVEFIYPFTVIVYDEEGIEVSREVVISDVTFNLVLLGVPEEYFINLSFPITTQINDGTEFEINNKEELLEVIRACIEDLEEVIIGECEGIASDEECVWEITLINEEEIDLYENSVFLPPVAGINTYYYRGIAYDSSWIFLFIGNQLYLNIALDDPEEIGTGQFWNFNWRLQLVDEETFLITREGGVGYLLKKVCDEEEYCTELKFTECEIDGQPDMAAFLLEEYIECIDIMAAPFIEDPEAQVDFLYSFHLTVEDAENNSNPIDTTVPFMNSENPQTLHVRIEHPETAEFDVIEVVIEVETCE